MESLDRIFLNGIDGVTGEYLIPPMTAARAATIIKGNPMDRDLARWLSSLWRTISRPNLSLPFDIDATDVAAAGWGIVFHRDEDPAVREAMAPLIEHRRRLVIADRFKELEYRDGESRAGWLARHDGSAGSVEPWKVPFYLLLVGSPEKIPFVFGHLLTVEYAVGRLWFETPAEYRRYAENLVDYETTASVPNAREAVFFAPRHPFDPATEMCASLLVEPLADGVPSRGARPPEPGVAERWGYRTRKFWGHDATKASLSGVLVPPAGCNPPAFLLTASHGVGFPKGHPDQETKQGSLLCQDWEGRGRIDAEHYFAASDLMEEARVRGLISFHFACYSAGTPAYDRFLHMKGGPPPPIADRPFVAALPRALMAHRAGGALACIGHVERAWGYSIVSPKGTPQLLPFRNAIDRILSGQPVGYALKDFYERYAALATSLNSALDEFDFGVNVPDDELATMWVERNDAEGYVVLGDPAAHLRNKDLS